MSSSDGRSNAEGTSGDQRSVRRKLEVVELGGRSGQSKELKNAKAKGPRITKTDTELKNNTIFPLLGMGFMSSSSKSQQSTLVTVSEMVEVVAETVFLSHIVSNTVIPSYLWSTLQIKYSKHKTSMLRAIVEKHQCSLKEPCWMDNYRFGQNLTATTPIAGVIPQPLLPAARNRRSAPTKAVLDHLEDSHSLLSLCNAHSVTCKGSSSGSGCQQAHVTSILPVETQSAVMSRFSTEQIAGIKAYLEKSIEHTRIPRDTVTVKDLGSSLEPMLTRFFSQTPERFVFLSSDGQLQDHLLTRYSNVVGAAAMLIVGHGSPKRAHTLGLSPASAWLGKRMKLVLPTTSPSSCPSLSIASAPQDGVPDMVPTGSSSNSPPTMLTENPPKPPLTATIRSWVSDNEKVWTGSDMGMLVDDYKQIKSVKDQIIKMWVQAVPTGREALGAEPQLKYAEYIRNTMNETISKQTALELANLLTNQCTNEAGKQ